MSALHTPGPWYADTSGIVRAGEPGQRMWANPIKLASAWKEDAWCDNDATDESRANARLIAAAPCMVSAGQSLLASLDPDTLNPEQFNAWSDLQAAIARATGAA